MAKKRRKTTRSGNTPSATVRASGASELEQRRAMYERRMKAITGSREYRAAAKQREQDIADSAPGNRWIPEVDTPFCCVLHDYNIEEVDTSNWKNPVRGVHLHTFTFKMVGGAYDGAEFRLPYRVRPFDKNSPFAGKGSRAARQCRRIIESDGDGPAETELEWSDRAAAMMFADPPFVLSAKLTTKRTTDEHGRFYRVEPADAYPEDYEFSSLRHIDENAVPLASTPPPTDDTDDTSEDEPRGEPDGEGGVATAEEGDESAVLVLSFTDEDVRNTRAIQALADDISDNEDWGSVKIDYEDPDKTWVDVLQEIGDALGVVGEYATPDEALQAFQYVVSGEYDEDNDL